MVYRHFLCYLCPFLEYKKKQRKFQTFLLFLLQGSEVVLVCEVGNLNNNQVVWKQGDRPISAGDVKVVMINSPHQTLINHDPISDKTGQQNESPTQLGGDKPQDHKTQVAGCR